MSTQLPSCLPFAQVLATWSAGEDSCKLVSYLDSALDAGYVSAPWIGMRNQKLADIYYKYEPMCLGRFAK